MTGSLATVVSPAAAFDLVFVESGGGQRREPLPSAWSMRFETVPPVRKFVWSAGQRHFPGQWWSATTGDHVGFESWLERDNLVALDFDPEVVGLSSQPFWLVWSDSGKTRRHAPDYFARLADGAGVVIDVRADDRIEPRDAEAFAATAAACEAVGWSYRRVGTLEPVLTANLRWLSGYRYPRCLRTETAAGLREVFAAGPLPLLEGARGVGDSVAVLPTLFHLMWAHVLVADLAAAALSDASVLTLAGGDPR